MAANCARAESEAIKLLLAQRLHHLPVDVTKLRCGKKVIFHTYRSFCKNTSVALSHFEQRGDLRDGCTLRRKSGGKTLFLVLYNDKVISAGRKRFTLAHEMGHICLGHEGDGPDEELEADCFAAQLLLPYPLVWELNLRSACTVTAKELAGVFGASQSAAQSRLRNLKKSNAFTQDERTLLNKYAGLLPCWGDPQIDC